MKVTHSRLVALTLSLLIAISLSYAQKNQDFEISDDNESLVRVEEPLPEPVSIGISEKLLAEILKNIDDPQNGEILYSGKYNCSGCHENGYGTATEKIWSATINERLTLEQFEGYSAEQYIIESILEPAIYDYPDDTYIGGAMPANYGDRMPQQDIIDIVQYLKTLRTQE